MLKKEKKRDQFQRKLNGDWRCRRSKSLRYGNVIQGCHCENLESQEEEQV